jgi:hypothetical protein
MVEHGPPAPPGSTSTPDGERRPRSPRLELADVWVVVVNYEGGAANLHCLASAVADGVPAERIVFVDNASTDGALTSVLAAHPGLRTIVNDANVGFGHAANQGLELARRAGAGAVLLLNNDAELVPGCLAELLAAAAARPDAGVLGPLVLLGRTGERVWAAGGRVTWRTNLSRLVGHRRALRPVDRVARDVDYVPGCALLVRTQVLEAIGLLDGDFFAYHEDVDFCLRARAAGFAVHYVGSAVCRHDAHLSTGGGYNPRRKYMMAVNTVWFLRRHGTALRWLGFALCDVAPLPALALVGLFVGRWRGALAKALGTWHGLRGRRVAAPYLRAGASPLW